MLSPLPTLSSNGPTEEGVQMNEEDSADSLSQKRAKSPVPFPDKASNQIQQIVRLILDARDPDLNEQWYIDVFEVASESSAPIWRGEKLRSLNARRNANWKSSSRRSIHYPTKPGARRQALARSDINQSYLTIGSLSPADQSPEPV
jgi:hypothetical protein